MQFTQSVFLALGLASAAVAKTISVQVAPGGKSLTFSPNSIQADTGDVLEFFFNPKNHTVTESTFDSPCAPMEGGFNSGFLPTLAGNATQPTWTYKVADTNTHWFYCAQPGHCEAGMAGVLNPPTSGNQTADAFVAAAKKTSNTTIPTTVTGGTVGSVAANTTASPSGSSTSSSPSSSASHANSASKAAGAGVFAAAGAFAALLL